jgi:hypothetical protein
MNEIAEDEFVHRAWMQSAAKKSVREREVRLPCAQRASGAGQRR